MPFTCAPASAPCWDLELPSGAAADFNTGGVFHRRDVTVPRSATIGPSDGDPIGLEAGTKLFGVDIIGGCGANQFEDGLKARGSTFTMNSELCDWLHNTDTDIQLITGPAPEALSCFSRVCLS